MVESHIVTHIFEALDLKRSYGPSVKPVSRPLHHGILEARAFDPGNHLFTECKLYLPIVLGKNLVPDAIWEPLLQCLNEILQLLHQFGLVLMLCNLIPSLRLRDEGHRVGDGMI